MKKMLALFVPALLLLGPVYAAGTPSAAAVVTAPFDQTRDVSGFSGVASAGAFDVFITTGGKESVRLEGDDDLLDKIETVVEGKTLHIRTKKEYESDRLDFSDVKIHVTARELNALTLSGSGRMRVNSPLKADAFSATVSGSGQIEAGQITSNRMEARISGSGGFEASGSAKETEITVSGSGGFEGKNFTAGDAHVRVSGSGSVYLRAENTLDGVLSGSGRIHYSGNAKVTERKSGSGRIIKT
jgi:opacity protein-like surface antigen